MKIIDVHSHMFNLKYLPVAGILRRYTDNRMPPVIASGIEWLFIRNTRSVFEPDELQITSTVPFSEIKLNPQLLSKTSEYYSMDKIFKLDNKEINNAICDLVSPADLINTPLEDAINEFIHSTDSLEYAKYKVFDKSIANELSINEAIVDEAALVNFKFNYLRQMLDSVIEKYTEIRNYLKWFLFMTGSEDEIFKFLTKKDEIDVEKYVHLMMDVDAFFVDEINGKRHVSYFDFVDNQINNMQKLNRKHSDKLIGFVAFNPSRDNCIEIIDNAIKKKGFKGVKFYPPLGYKAYGDEKYDVNIKKLINYCVSNSVPLFTHCNNIGFEANRRGNSGFNSNPVYWEKVLIDNPELILCLAHGGGVEGWFSSNKEDDKTVPDSIHALDIKDPSNLQKSWNDSYASMVYKLCVQYKNVYCDAAYLDEMINADGTFETTTKNNFKTRLLKLFLAQPEFSKKIMYGSDWHMLFQEGKNNVFLKSYISFFNDVQFNSYRDDFFYNNAVRFLGLEIKS